MADSVTGGYDISGCPAEPADKGIERRNGDVRDKSL